MRAADYLIFNEFLKIKTCSHEFSVYDVLTQTSLAAGKNSASVQINRDSAPVEAVSK